MNDRIRELALQAGFTMISDVCYDKVSVASVNEFAELIVEEMYIYMCDATDNDKPWPTFKEVKQHFGVEE